LPPDPGLDELEEFGEEDPLPEERLLLPPEPDEIAPLGPLLGPPAAGPALKRVVP